MRYILSLLLLAIISTYDIFDKEQEINEVGEYNDIKLQFLFGYIAFIRKVSNATLEHLNKVKTFIRETEIFELIETAEKFITNETDKDRQIIMKGKLLIKEFKNFKNSTIIINKAKRLYNRYYKGIQLFVKRKPYRLFNELERREIYKLYIELKDTYYKFKYFYGNITSYYEETKEFYGKTIPKHILQSRRQNKLKEKLKAFGEYNQLKKSKMNYDQKKEKIESLLNYMFEKGFITQSQKQRMSEISKI